MTTRTTFNESLLRGALGFSVVSLIVFATVAFGERWLYQNLGLAGAYLLWTILFIALGGAAFGSLVTGRWRLPRFYLLFAVAFFAYAAGWTVAYFVLRGAKGEWVGSLLGSLLMALVFAAGFSALKSILKLFVLLFIANSLGYFLGAICYTSLAEPTGMLLWGVIYGLFLGAGVGGVLHLSQTSAG